MKYPFILFAVFFLGFLSGSLWQTLQQNLRPIPAEPPISAQRIEKMKKVEKAEIPVEPEPPKMTNDDKVSQALSDPDFKRVHDFLMRENPVQMKIEQYRPQIISPDANTPNSPDKNNLLLEN